MTLKQMLETLETKLNDKSWTDTQEKEFVKLLDDMSKATHNLATRTYIMADIIDKFYETIVDLFEMTPESATSVPQNGDVYPESNTNFSAEGAE